MPQKKYFPPRNLETDKLTVFGESAFRFHAATANQMIWKQLLAWLFIEMFDMLFLLFYLSYCTPVLIPFIYHIC